MKISSIKYLADLMSTVFEEYHLQNCFAYVDSCLVFFYFDILSLIKKKTILGFSFSFSFDFPANACFFLSSGRLYVAWKILCSEGVFPGRWALPHLALTVVWPWAGHEFQDLGPESFTRMWRLDISSLHLWYQNVGPKKSNSKTLIWKITYFCMRKETIIRVLIYGLFS